MELKVPNLGENISESNIIAIHLEKGKEIQKDDIILELETDKATLEIPSPDCGIVKEILVKVGDSIKQGQVVAILEESTSEPAKEDPEKEEAEIPKTKPTETPETEPTETKPTDKPVEEKPYLTELFEKEDFVFGASSFTGSSFAGSDVLSSKIATTCPCFILSPTFTNISLTIPQSGEGISKVALSVSSSKIISSF